MIFDSRVIEQYLSDFGQPYSLNIFPQIDSTNSWLLKQSSTGRLSVCITDHQTDGRGRRGRIWQSSPGDSLCLSVRYPLSLPLHQLSGLSLVMALSAKHVVGKYSDKAIAIKWPNDLLISGKKLAGILVETTSVKSDSLEVVVGIGINLKPVKDSELKAVSLAEYDYSEKCEPNRLVADLLMSLVADMDKFQSEGFDGFLTPWREQDSWIGKPVRLVLADKSIDGEYVGVDEDGQLLIRNNTGVRAYMAGEVSLRMQNQDYETTN